MCVCVSVEGVVNQGLERGVALTALTLLTVRASVAVPQLRTFTQTALRIVDAMHARHDANAQTHQSCASRNHVETLAIRAIRRAVTATVTDTWGAA